MRTTVCALTIVLLSLTAVRNGLAEQSYNNDRALDGVQNIKAYFDVTVGEPAKLLVRLQLIDTTFKQLQAAGLSPDFVIGIRGKASNFFTTGDSYILDEDRPSRLAVEEWVRQGREKGYHVEQCRIAAKMQEIEVGDFLPQLEIVANGYTSIIGYQSRGYAFVPMD